MYNDSFFIIWLKFLNNLRKDSCNEYVDKFYTLLDKFCVRKAFRKKATFPSPHYRRFIKSRLGTNQLIEWYLYIFLRVNRNVGDKDQKTVEAVEEIKHTLIS